MANVSSKIKKPKKNPRLQIRRDGTTWIIDVCLPQTWLLAIVLMIVIRYLPEWWSIIQTILPILGN